MASIERLSDSYIYDYVRQEAQNRPTIEMIYVNLSMDDRGNGRWMWVWMRGWELW